MSNRAPVPGHQKRIWFLVIVCAAAVAGLFWVGPIAQDPGYHTFADTRSLAGISNFWNVVSNLPFLLAGLWGLARAARLAAPESRSAYVILCVGVCLVCFGSAYYHAAPSNYSLLWDRLPMTVVFMALLSLLLGERVIGTHKLLTLWLLVAFGGYAAIYWFWTESQGRGDLRLYALAQFLPLVLIPLILLIFPARYIRSPLLVGAFALYLLAKGFEHFDRQIYEATRLISGHTFKHVAAALAALCIIAAVRAHRADGSSNGMAAPTGMSEAPLPKSNGGA